MLLKVSLCLLHYPSLSGHRPDQFIAKATFHPCACSWALDSLFAIKIVAVVKHIKLHLDIAKTPSFGAVLEKCTIEDIQFSCVT